MVDVSALDKNAGLQYNGLGVHPVTGRVYINTLKSFANYGQNQIWGFDFGISTELRLSSTRTTPASRPDSFPGEN